MFVFYSCSAQKEFYLYLFVLQILLSGLNSERIGMIPSHSYVHLQVAHTWGSNAIEVLEFAWRYKAGKNIEDRKGNGHLASNWKNKQSAGGLELHHLVFRPPLLHGDCWWQELGIHAYHRLQARTPSHSQATIGHESREKLPQLIRTY